MRKECIQGFFVELNFVTRSASDPDLPSFSVFGKTTTAGTVKAPSAFSLSVAYLSLYVG